MCICFISIDKWDQHIDISWEMQSIFYMFLIYDIFNIGSLYDYIVHVQSWIGTPVFVSEAVAW